MRVTSMNDLKGQHWSKYAVGEKKRWLSALSMLLGEGVHCGERRSVLIRAQVNDHRKLYDQDNFKAGCKPILDSLKKLGWIKDDNLKWVEVRYEQEVVPMGEDSTMIAILPTVEHLFCQKCLATLLPPATISQEQSHARGRVCSCCGGVAEFSVELLAQRIKP
jgi:hypothetical protein